MTDVRILFENDMRALGYRVFTREGGRYCLQILNELFVAYCKGRARG